MSDFITPKGAAYFALVVGHEKEVCRVVCYTPYSTDAAPLAICVRVSASDAFCCGSTFSQTEEVIEPDHKIMLSALFIVELETAPSRYRYGGKVNKIFKWVLIKVGHIFIAPFQIC